jgi:hypothetical protein
MGRKGAGHRAYLTKMRNLRTHKRKKPKSKGHVVGFYKERGKTKPITKSVAQLKQKKVVAKGRRFNGVKPKKKWMQKAKQSGHVKQGGLSKYGYSANASPEARHKALRVCVNAEGMVACRSKIQLLANVTTNGTRLDKIYNQDLAFLDGITNERKGRWEKTNKAAYTKPKERKGYRIVAKYPSKSQPGKFHYVERGPKGGLRCNCLSYIYSRESPKTCKHVEDYRSKHKK